MQSCDHLYLIVKHCQSAKLPFKWWVQRLYKCSVLARPWHCGIAALFRKMRHYN